MQKLLVYVVNVMCKNGFTIYVKKEKNIGGGETGHLPHI